MLPTHNTMETLWQQAIQYKRQRYEPKVSQLFTPQLFRPASLVSQGLFERPASTYLKAYKFMKGYRMFGKWKDVPITRQAVKDVLNI